jgi:guanylate kinase
LIVNKELEKAQKELEAIIRAEHCRRERMIGVLETMLTKNKW